LSALLCCSKKGEIARRFLFNNILESLSDDDTKLIRPNIDVVKFEFQIIHNDKAETGAKPDGTFLSEKFPASYVVTLTLDCGCPHTLSSELICYRGFNILTPLAESELEFPESGPPLRWLRLD
jgi:hypothetical protein